MAEAHDVVSPLGRQRIRQVAADRGAGGVRTVAFVWDDVFKGDEMEPVLRDALRSRRPELTFVGHEAFGNSHDGDVIAALGPRLRERDVDAVVSLVGACGSCTPAVMRACATAEEHGVPSVAVVGDGFGQTARTIGVAMGIPHVPVLSYPGPGLIMADSEEVFAAKVRALAEEVADAVLAPAATTDAPESQPAASHAPRQVVCSGSFDEVQEHFLRRGWTDGLPVVPPTIDRVERFLAHVDRDRAEVLGVLEPDMREVTPWTVAVNAVMAGCRPEHAEVVLAVAECMAAPEFLVGDFGCTPGIAPLVVVSGAVVSALDFNHGPGVMRVGRQANSAIGRFAQLFLVNLAGIRLAGGANRDEDVGERGTDNGAIAQSFPVVMAEDSRAVAALGWSSFSADRGFADDAGVVTVTSLIAASAPIYSGGETAEEHLATIADKASKALGSWGVQGALYLKKRADWNPSLLLISPGVAHRLAEDGVGKDEIRASLGERCRISAREIEDDLRSFSRIDSPVDRAVAEGWLPPAYATSEDPERLVPQLLDPDRLQIVVGGHPGRNQSKLFVAHSVFGSISSRAVPA